MQEIEPIVAAETIGDGLFCTTTLLHDSGETVTFKPYFIPVDKRTAHGHGSAATYVRRFSLVSLFALTPKDDDGNVASGVVAKDNGAAEKKKKMALADFKKSQAAKNFSQGG